MNTDKPSLDKLNFIEKFEVKFSKDGSANNLKELFDYIRDCWWSANWGWHECKINEDGIEEWQFKISTGGWSGNEELIDSFHANLIAWSSSWYSSRRGGHYEFRVSV